MRESLFVLSARGKVNRQARTGEVLVSAIPGGQSPVQGPVPSSRKMTRRPGVSRNRVVPACQGLIGDGYIAARERSGHYLNGDILNGRAERPAFDKPDEFAPALYWQEPRIGMERV